MLTRTPYTKEDFAWTQWSAQDIAAMVPKTIEAEQAQFAAIKVVPEAERTFENTIAALDRAQNDAHTVLLKIDFLMNVSPLPEVREAAKEASETLTNALIESAYDEDIYAAVKAYAGKSESLDGAQEKLLNDTLRAYRRMGFELPVEVRAEVKELSKQIAELSTSFQKNINDWKDHITVTREDLEGLPETYIAGLKQDAEGKYLVTLAYPDVIPFMENAKNAAKRQELADKNAQKGGQKNLDILGKIIALRKKKSALLGYVDYADYRTEERMAKTGATVRAFLEGLRTGAQPLVAKEIADLVALKRAETGDPAAELLYYDVPYYARLLQEKRYDLDDQKLKEYFPLEQVKQGMFEIYQTILGVAFTRIEGMPLWHEDVELYEVRNGDGALVSYFLLDLYPREGKYSHAAAFNIENGHVKREGGTDAYRAPVACMVTNFPRPRKAGSGEPSGEEGFSPKPVSGNPSLMSHSEVETFLHEFGHVMHHVLTQAAYPSQSGFSTAWDFVEAPSQMLENWAWEYDSLALLAKHYKTGEAMPKDLIEKLRTARLHMAGYDVMRQLSFGILDFVVHTESIENPLNEISRDISMQLIGIAPSPKSLQPAGFGHIGGGYDVGYYGYLWSKVYAADMYTRFADGKVLDPAVGQAYRQWILEKGSSMDEIDLVRGFLGREPNREAFLKSIGLTQ